MIDDNEQCEIILRAGKQACSVSSLQAPSLSSALSELALLTTDLTVSVIIG